MPETVARIVAPHFVAGIIMSGDRCIRAAPILGWAVGRDTTDLRAYFRAKGWESSILPEKELTQ